MTTFRFPDLAGQRGFATTAQLLKAGASEWDLTQMAVAGRRVVRSVYRSGVGELALEDLWVVGSLWAGPRSALTGAQALACLGLVNRHTLVAGFRFLVPPQGRVRRNPLGMVTQPTRRTPRKRFGEGIACASVERALVDAARRRELPGHAIKALTVAVLQKRMTTVERVAAEIASGGDALTGGVQEGLFAHRAGAWSAPESALIEAVDADPRFPAMLANVRLEEPGGKLIGTPDGYFPDHGVVVQVHSEEFHTGLDDEGRDRFEGTFAADSHFMRHGLVVVPVTPGTLTTMPAFLDGLHQVLAANEGRTTPHVRVVRDAHGWASDPAS